jgi:hypothetical protein
LTSLTHYLLARTLQPGRNSGQEGDVGLARARPAQDRGGPQRARRAKPGPKASAVISTEMLLELRSDVVGMLLQLRSLSTPPESPGSMPPTLKLPVPGKASMKVSLQHRPTRRARHGQRRGSAGEENKHFQWYIPSSRARSIPSTRTPVHISRNPPHLAEGILDNWGAS